MQKFLIIQTAFIGDVVLATALVEKLAQFFPAAQIDFFLRKGNEGLLTHHPKIRKTYVWDKKNGKYKNLWKLLQEVRAERYDKVINVQRFAATGFVTAFSKAKETIGFDKNPWSFAFSKKIKHIVSTPEKPLHEVDRNQALIADFTDHQACKPRLYPQAPDYALVKAYQSKDYVCVAPASVWFTKQFPAHKWIEFLQKLPTNYVVYLLGAPSDKDLCESILKANPQLEIYNLAGQFNFLQSVALQEKAAMNYVNDSAPMHFASSVNAPVAAIYCSTIPAFGFGPLSDESHIVEVAEDLECRPCGLHGFKACPKGHFKCAEDIHANQLISIL